MELKKSPKADLENKRNIFVQIGWVLSLAICLYAFESTSKVAQVESLGTVADQAVEEEIIPCEDEELVEKRKKGAVVFAKAIRQIRAEAEVE